MKKKKNSKLGLENIAKQLDSLVILVILLSIDIFGVVGAMVV